MTLIAATSTLPSRRRAPVLVVAPLACLVFLLPDLGAVLQYDRDAIASGQAWRPLTCHLTHWSFTHLAWDVLCFAGLALACHARRVSAPRTWTALLVAAVSIPAAVWVFMPYASTYRGLSGLVSTLFALLAVDLVRRRREGDRTGTLLAACVMTVFLAKCAFDLRLHWQLAGATPPNAAGVYPLFPDFIPAPVAHLVGAAVGSAAAFVRSPANPRPATIPRA